MWEHGPPKRTKCGPRFVGRLRSAVVRTEDKIHATSSCFVSTSVPGKFLQSAAIVRSSTHIASNKAATRPTRTSGAACRARFIDTTDGEMQTSLLSSMRRETQQCSVPQFRPELWRCWSWRIIFHNVVVVSNEFVQAITAPGPTAKLVLVDQQEWRRGPSIGLYSIVTSVGPPRSTAVLGMSPLVNLVPITFVSASDRALR